MNRAALPAAGLAAALMLGLAGCGTTDTGIGAGTATALQQEVRHIADLAAAHRYPAALAAAGALRSDLRTAVETGRVPSARGVRIGAALDLVETDLRTARRSAGPSPTPTSTPTPSPTATSTPTATAAPAKTMAPKKKAPAPTKAPAPLQFRWHGKWSKGHKGKGD